MDLKSYPRIIIAGLGGDSGKTFVSTGLLRYFRDKGLKPGIFKKGPDYIDPAWLKLAGADVARNLDTYLMPEETLKQSFLKNAFGKDISLVEGNRGLFDGFDSQGSHSTAELAKMLGLPVILVVTVKKVTRTVSAYVLGCKNLDPDLNIAAVIVNQVANKRHEKIIRDAIENDTGIPVIGSIPKLEDGAIMPSRHLGLVTPGEFEMAEIAVQTAKDAIEQYVDIEKIIAIANSTENLEYTVNAKSVANNGKSVKIGYFGDIIFSFYYPESIEALAEEGAELVNISSYEDRELPDIDALFIGGGFPETNIDLLLKNKSMMESVRKAADDGMPIYSECGGYMYLGKSIVMDGKEYEMCGVLPVKFRMNRKPQGHGYAVVKVDSENPFFEKGIEIKGHEFHYSNVSDRVEGISTCLEIQRGSGSFEKRDGLMYKNVFGSYIHIHPIGCPQWQKGMMNAAINYKKSKL